MLLLPSRGKEEGGKNSDILISIQSLIFRVALWLTPDATARSAPPYAHRAACGSLYLPRCSQEDTLAARLVCPWVWKGFTFSFTQPPNTPTPLSPTLHSPVWCVCVCLQARTRIISPCSMLALFKSIISPSTGSIQRGSGALRSCPLNGCLCPLPQPHPAHPHFSVDSFDASVKMRRPRGNNGQH